MEPTDIFILCALIVGLILVVLFRKRKDQDGRAMYWATVAEPFYLIPDHPFDNVEARAEEVRENLRLHGNKKLRPNVDVQCAVYRVSGFNHSSDFAMFQEMAYKAAIQFKEDFRLEKIKHTQSAAAEFTVSK